VPAQRAQRGRHGMTRKSVRERTRAWMRRACVRDVPAWCVERGSPARARVSIRARIGPSRDLHWCTPVRRRITIRSHGGVPCSGAHVLAHALAHGRTIARPDGCAPTCNSTAAAASTVLFRNAGGTEVGVYSCP
jgi:hypothetical protein